MSLFDDTYFRALMQVVLTPPPSRAETIIEAWKEAQPLFDYRLGKLTVVDAQGMLEPITYELLDYGDKTVVEAEGVVVQTMPRLQC